MVHPQFLGDHEELGS